MNEFLYEIANIPFDIKGLKNKIVPSWKAFSGETSSVFFVFFQFCGFESLVTSPKQKKHFLGRIYTKKKEHFQKKSIFFVTKWQKISKFSLNH
jgi:hypothetical protein